jgi:nitroimidazol reductase NimA-like FMN-containing flavoprotein (pyridoxamine 5'-phosphate oxidase superfamily)
VRVKKNSKAPRSTRPHMPGYGLPKGTKGLLPWKWAEDRLKKSHNYWIATTRPDGRPHVMVVWALWLDRALYFSTGSQSRKAQNLAANPKCVMCTDRAEQAVIVEGVAERVRDQAKLRQVLALYERKYDYDLSAFEKDILALKEPIFAVRPRVIFSLDEKKSLPTATRWNFPAVTT